MVVPPFYLYAFEVGGVPTVTLVGSDLTNMLWTAAHKRGRDFHIQKHRIYVNISICAFSGAQLMLTMMDSQNNTGGVLPNLFTIEGALDAWLPESPYY